MTDPGPPPEEALDATLRALAAPVPAQARRTPESAGLDNAHYHAEAHRPPKAHGAPPSAKASTTEPMSAALTPLVRGTARMKPQQHRADLTTVPRAAPPPSRTSTFIAALVFVVAVLGVATWALLRSSPAPPGVTTPPRRAPTAAISAAPSSPPAVTTTGTPPAPTTKYNHLLNEDKQ